MSIFSKLFGGGGAPKQDAEPVTHGDYRIFPEPMKEAGGYRIAARIEKDAGGATRTHHLIRADVCQTEDEARETSILKAKQMIDQQGDGIFE